jgi:hypothetical protein
MQQSGSYRYPDMSNVFIEYLSVSCTINYLDDSTTFWACQVLSFDYIVCGIPVVTVHSVPSNTLRGILSVNSNFLFRPSLISHAGTDSDMLLT